MNNELSVGERIKKRRKELNITQSKLAERIQKKPITIKQYERGARTPDLETKIKIANALNCSYSDLFDPIIDLTVAGAIAALPEIGVEIEGDPHPEETQAKHDERRIDDYSQDINNYLRHSGLVYPVSGKYYLFDENRKAVILDPQEYAAYVRSQIANIAGHHYDYVDLLRSMRPDDQK